mgnify:CR=1 FL=1
MIEKKNFYPWTLVLFAAKNMTSCIGHKRKQAMDNIIMNCQRNDSKMQSSQIVQPNFQISRGIFCQQRRWCFERIKIRTGLNKSQLYRASVHMILMAKRSI